MPSAPSPHSSMSRKKWAVSAQAGSKVWGDPGVVGVAKACRAFCIFIKRCLFLETGKCIQSSRKKKFTFEECFSIVEMGRGVG